MQRILGIVNLRFFYFFCLPLGSVCIMACTSKKNSNDARSLVVATCADYPPFEYYTPERSLKGFDIDLVRLIAQNLKKRVVFEVFEFSSIFAALETKRADIGISTIAITSERKKKIDFSRPYYTQKLYALFRKSDLDYFKKVFYTKNEKKIGKIFGCQMGTTMENWIQTQHPDEKCITMDENLPLVEALKSERIDVVILDGYQAKTFCRKNIQLSCLPIGNSINSYGIAFPKNSSLFKLVNEALKVLEKNGAIEKLKHKYHLD
ncbi:ABC transporter substrate-binding protein [Holospora obtusa]|uniref:ABC transporter substrate-binding protein n=1 Tax=Holospora obtusa TaxID=49893 RepID=UPI0003AEE883|nr:ABC transporter substrate-binding protein [Holospora obtusa]